MKLMITGGAGFIGCNTAKKMAEDGWNVTVLDNLSRRGTEQNLDWLREHIRFEFLHADVRDAKQVADFVERTKPDVVIHLAGQAAVTTSIIAPREDFEINALGTLNVLEALRLHSPQTILLNASTNKVYGSLSGLGIRETDSRYELVNPAFGVSELQPLDFHSPYGCSKGTADQYVADYARIYGLRTANFRQSCIYGPHQFGIEDQGWVAWFTIAHRLGREITIYGTGKQVRDLLHVNDLILAYQAAIERIDQFKGHSFNMGGGPEYALSILELIKLLGELSGRQVRYEFGNWRPGDQSIYVSDIRQARELLEWHPQISPRDGVKWLHHWVVSNAALLDKIV